MSDLQVIDKQAIARRQILVVHVNSFTRTDDREALRNSILEQMESGVVVLPNNCNAMVCDADVVVAIKDGESCTSHH